MSTCEPLRAPGNEIWTLKFEKSENRPFLRSFFAHISSHNGIWEKWPPTLFHCSPVGGHMQSFRKIVRASFEIDIRISVLEEYILVGGRRRTLPAPPCFSPTKRRGHLALQACVKIGPLKEIELIN